MKWVAPTTDRIGRSRPQPAVPGANPAPESLALALSEC